MAAANRKERWRKVPGFERYFVSSSGRVQGPSGRILKPMWTGRKRKQYATIRLSTNPRVDRKVHIMVLESFRGPRPDEALGLHINDDTTDNRLANLIWGTASKNALMCDWKKGQKLTRKCRSKIRELAHGGVPKKAIASKFKVSPQRVSDVLHGRSAK